MTPEVHPPESLALTLADRLPERSLKAIREDLEDGTGPGLHLLARALAKQAEARVVLVLDQFEELFTLTTDEDERQRFPDLLLTALTEPRGPVLVLMTLRADLYDRLTQYPDVAQTIKAHLAAILGNTLRAMLRDLCPTFRVTCSQEQVQIELHPFNDRRLNRDLARLCERWKQHHSVYLAGDA